MSHLETEAFSAAAAAATSRAMLVTTALRHENLIVFVNPAFTALTGYPPHEAIGRDCRFLQGPGTDANTVRDIREAVAAGRPIRCEILNYRKDGTSFWNDLTIDPIRNTAGELLGFVGMQYNCSEMRAATVAREEAEHRLTAIVDSVPGYIYQRVLRPSGEIFYSYMSRSIARILGLPGDADQLVEQAIRHVHPEDIDRIEAQIAESARTLTPFLAEFRFISVSGQEHWFRSESAPHKMENGDIVWDGLAVEITAEKLSEAKIAHLAYHDSLTSLPNRLLFNSTLLRALSHPPAERANVGIFSIDLDNFQSLNDTYGEVIGDKVLRRIGLRLREYAEPLGGTAARLGGDEFSIVLPNLPTDVSGLELAQSISLAIRRPMVVDGARAAQEASVGAVVLPHQSVASPVAATEEWGAELLNRANLALQVAKRDGSGVCRLYSSDLDDRHRLRPELRKSLIKAIEEEQFTLHYQPIVNLASGEIVGAEALVRWEHPELGLQRPDLFIPMAESSGLILPLGAWAIKAAMRQAEIWKRDGISPIRIAINVSSVQLKRPGFLTMVQQTLAETGADARQFEFELTESILLQPSIEINELFGALRQLGFGLVIDDFGTGHASFGYLRNYLVDKLKIDQVFVRHLVMDSSDAAIIRAIVALCRSLHLSVLAEGVETALQREFLIREGCLIGQGYLFSLPLRAEDFGWMLQSGLTLPIQLGRE